MAAARPRLDAASIKAGTVGSSPSHGGSSLGRSAKYNRSGYDVQRNLAQAQTELADLTSRLNSTWREMEKGEWNKQRKTATAARMAVILGQQEKRLEAVVYEKAAQLEHVRPARDSLDAEQHLARIDVENARTKLGELRASSTFRGERLEVLDPGIVPERPSYPNVPLILLVALAVSLLASLAYLAAAFGYSRAMSARAERVYHMR